MMAEWDGTVMLALSQEDLERSIHNMEALRDLLLEKFLEDDNDRKELRDDFKVAITAMMMLWVMMEEGEEE